jgi:hypothetical protein
MSRLAGWEDKSESRGVLGSMVYFELGGIIIYFAFLLKIRIAFLVCCYNFFCTCNFRQFAAKGLKREAAETPIHAI